MHLLFARFAFHSLYLLSYILWTERKHSEEPLCWTFLFQWFTDLIGIGSGFNIQWAKVEAFDYFLSKPIDLGKVIRLPWTWNDSSFFLFFNLTLKHEIYALECMRMFWICKQFDAQLRSVIWDAVLLNGFDANGLNQIGPDRIGSALRLSIGSVEPRKCNASM